MGDKDLSEEWDRKYLERKCQKKKKDNYSGEIKARLSLSRIFVSFSIMNGSDSSFLYFFLWLSW